MLKALAHPLDGASLIDVLDYAARRIADARDKAEGPSARQWQLAMDRFDEAYMWTVAAQTTEAPNQ